jgi:hypothetical protein
MIDNSRSLYLAIGRLKKIWYRGNSVAARSSMTTEPEALQTLFAWYDERRFVDVTPFSRDYGEAPVTGSRVYSSNFAPTVRAEYFHAGRRHFLHFHLEGDNFTPLINGLQEDLGFLALLWQFVIDNYGCTDFQLIGLTGRPAGTSSWLPIQPQVSFVLEPGPNIYSNHNKLGMSGYARIEGTSASPEGLAVKGSMTFHGLLFSQSSTTFNDARVTDSELPGLSAKITECNDTERLCSVANTPIVFKPYLNVGYSANARKAARRA